LKNKKKTSATLGFPPKAVGNNAYIVKRDITKYKSSQIISQYIKNLTV